MLKISEMDDYELTDDELKQIEKDLERKLRKP